MNHWEPFGIGYVHVSTQSNSEPGVKGSLRRAKKEMRRVRRFLNTRVKWSAWFAQELQGQAIMRGVWAAAKRRK